jgi:hypothetical protein
MPRPWTTPTAWAFVTAPLAFRALNAAGRRPAFRPQHIRGPFLLDINSVSPRRKQETARLVGDSARYVDVAVAFARATVKPIDYAVMERTARATVMPVSYGWSDVGSWQAVWELSAHETDENAAHGPAVFVDTRGSYVATERQLVALLGVENLVVVTTADAVLVARREASGGLRRVVGKLKEIAPALTEDL